MNKRNVILPPFEGVYIRYSKSEKRMIKETRTRDLAARIEVLKEIGASKSTIYRTKKSYEAWIAEVDGLPGHSK
jgi:hypothetical protein